MANAFADSIDARVEGLQRVVDQNSAIAGQSGSLCELDIGANARSHDHQISGNTAAITEVQRANTPLRIAV